MSARVESKDRGAAALVAAATKLVSQGRNTALRVGVLQGSAAHVGGTTVGEVAMFHEFGTATIPQRSFLRGWYDEYLDRNKALWRKMMARVARNELTREQALGQMGSLFVAQIQKRITDHIPPPLADSTIAHKGSSTPLIDTGQLKASITFDIVEA